MSKPYTDAIISIPVISEQPKVYKIKENKITIHEV